MNLRGVTESASILAYPVYLFVLALFILIGAGLYHIATGTVSPDLHTPVGTPVAGMTHVVANSLNYAKSLSPDQIIAVYVSFEREDEKKFEEKWKMWEPDVRLVTLHSYYRSIIQPLTKFIDTVQYKASESNYRVTVIIPQFIPKKGWHNILHNQSSLLIRAFLLYKRNVVITTVPYHLKK